MWTRAYRIRLRARRPRLPASREKTPKTHKNKRNLGNLRGRRIWALPISRARADFRATPNRYLICCNRAPGVGVMAVFAVREEPRSTGGIRRRACPGTEQSGRGKWMNASGSPRTHRNAEPSRPTPGVGGLVNTVSSRPRDGCDHTSTNAPDPIRTPKLSVLGRE